MSVLNEINNSNLIKKIKRFFDKNINLVYSSNYQIDYVESTIKNSFDSQKFRKIIKKLRNDGLLRYSDLIKPEKVTDEQILLVHSLSYLNWVKDPLNLQKIINTNNLTIFDTDSFDVFKYITGGTYLAALLALSNKKPSFNLSGGFHHAKQNKGDGFCPINDVAITITQLLKNNAIRKCLIIDLDYHQGDGNKDIFRNNNSVFLFSIHAAQWDNTYSKQSIDVEVNNLIKNEDYLDILNQNLSTMDSIVSPDIIFYLAGSDPYIYDELGDMELTEETMLQRDVIVYEFAKSREIPLVILPAGGYGNESYKIYYNFIRWALFKG